MILAIQRVELLLYVLQAGQKSSMWSDPSWYVAGNVDALAAAQENHDVQAAQLQQKEQNFAELLTDKQALEAQLEGQRGDLRNAESRQIATLSQLEQLQSQHQELAARSEQLEAEMQSSNQQLQTAEHQLQDKINALSALQLQHTGETQRTS